MNIFDKSESVKAGLRQGFQDGSPKMVKRKCYGCTVDSNGSMKLNVDEAQVLCWIFE